MADKLGIYFDETINNRLRGVSRMASLDIVLERSERTFTDEEKLAMAVFSILANEIGEIGTGYDYFMSSARLDLDDMHHNTKDGLHMANMAGTWTGLVRGFGGMRCRKGELSFAPVCPPQWQGYAFCVGYRGRTIRVSVNADGAKYELLNGEPITIRSHGESVELR